MMSAASDQQVPPLTAGEFAALPDEEGVRLELSRGQVVREPAPGPLHGHTAGRFYRLLWRWDEERALQAKALQYLDAGSKLVWIVDPERRTATVFRSRSEIRILEADDVLTGGDVLPDLRVPLSELFA